MTRRWDGAGRSAVIDQLVDRPRVSVILPTYNEAENIVDIVRVVLDLFSVDVGYENVEVLVIDDNSPDETWRVARDAFEEEPRVDVICRRSDKGLSSAVLSGFQLARGEIAVCMDADGQHPAERLRELVAAVEDGADLAVGSRHIDDGSIDGWPWSRKVTSELATLVARSLVPAAREISDPLSGFFAVDREVFYDEVLNAADPHGYKILLELAQLVPDAEVAEVPITFRAREAGTSKLTLDERLRFVEHCVSLWFLAVGLDERVSTPLLVRSVEAAFVAAFALALLYSGLVLGGVEGAVGAGLIAASGAAIVLGAQRLARSGQTWQDTEEVYAK